MMSETNSPPCYQFSSNQMGNLNNQSRRPSPKDNQTFQNKRGEDIIRRGKSIQGPVGSQQSKTKSSSLVKSRGSKKQLINSKEEAGEKYLNQYFKQKKHVGSINYKKYAQIDSPKDGSIERVRHVDII